MHVRACHFVACLVIAAAVSIAAQPLDRLTGRVITDAGAPVPDADVHVEAIFGFAGGDFLGQRTFATRTNAKGEWGLLAFKSGIWVFDVAAPGQLPDAVALPFNLVAPASSGIDRLTPSWHPLLRLSPLPPVKSVRCSPTRPRPLVRNALIVPRRCSRAWPTAPTPLCLRRPAASAC